MSISEQAPFSIDDKIFIYPTGPDIEEKYGVFILNSHTGDLNDFNHISDQSEEGYARDLAYVIERLEKDVRETKEIVYNLNLQLQRIVSKIKASTTFLDSKADDLAMEF